MNKKRARRAAKVKSDEPATAPGVNDLVSRVEIIATIAAKVKSPGDMIRQAKDKVGQRLAYAIKKSRLEPPVKGRLVFGDVVRWARTKPHWREKLAGLPQTDPPKAPPIEVRAEHVAIHDLSLKKCHVLLAEANEQLRTAHDELNRLRPLAKKWENFMATRTKRQK